MIPQPPPGQDPIDPRPAFSPPPPPGGGAPPPPPVQFQQGHPGPGPMPPGGGPPPGAFPPPPGGYPPPPMMPPFPPPPMYMPPPPPRHSFARGIFLTMATTIFGLSLAANIYLLLFSGLLSGSSASSRQTVISEGDAKQKIAVIPVVGIIMGEQAEQFDRFITMAERDKDVKAVVLAIDSPGGSVTASDEIHHRITQFRARTADQNRKVPIVVSMGSLAASGGYYVACAADYVIAEPTTMTGNIGVLFPRYNVSKLAEKWGVEETTLESTGADFKNAGSMFKPENPQEVAYFQNIIDQAFAQFKTVVRNGRTGHTGFDPKKLDDIANGKIYTARDAEKLGLIDHVGYMADAIAHATTSAGLSSPQVVRYHNPPSFFDVLTSGRSTAPSPDASAKVNASGVTVKMDWQTLQELTTPRLLYLWRGE